MRAYEQKWVAVFALAVACASKQTAPSPSAPSPGAAPEAPSTPVHLTDAVIVANECAKLGNVNARAAEKAMHKLVEGCAEVPGGVAQFTATLVPGGRIEIGASKGADPDQTTVPLCVLKNPLVHAVALPSPCKLDVRMEQTKVALPIKDAGAD